MSDDAPGTLELGEAHPAAPSAIRWILARPLPDLMLWRESFASSALSGNRTAEVCSETLRRVVSGEPVSDRYVVGLAWLMRYGNDAELEPTP